MRVATNLSELAGLKAYSLHPDNDDAQFLRKAIALLLPGAQFEGFVDGLSDQQGTVITVDSRWPQALQAGSSPRDLVVFPVTDVVGWEFWHFGREVIDRCKPGTPAVLPFADFVDFLEAWDPPVVRRTEGDKLTLEAPYEFNVVDQDRRTAFGDMAAIVQGRLANEESRNAYATAFQGGPVDVWHHYVRSVFSKTQYGQYVTLTPGDTVISIGIDEGMELPWMCAQLQGQGQIHAVDPFALDFLSRYSWQSIGSFPGLIRPHRLAMAGYNGTARLPFFDNTMAVGAMVNRTENLSHVEVPCLTVDTFVQQEKLSKVDLIKVDIEGGEEFLIEGMMGTINQLRPQIAIAIYHSFHHLWSLPLRLMSLCPNYRFYLDHYGFKRYDTVLYAIPAERVQPQYETAPQPLLVLS